MKKITRRSFLAIAVASGISLSLAACSKSNDENSSTSAETSSTSQATGEMTDMLLWLPPFGGEDSLDVQFWTQALEPWTIENNVNLSVEITPWGGYVEKYLTGYSTNAGPDVGYMYTEMMSEFITFGSITTIDSYFTQEEQDNYIYWDRGNVKGGQYALPFIVGNARILCFNMDILNAAGVTELPTTWDDLVQTAIKVKDNVPGVMPIAQEWSNPSIGALNNVYYPYLWQAGGDIYNADGSAVALADNDAAVKAAQFVYDLRYTHGVLTEESLALTADVLDEQFLQGNIAIASLSTATASELDGAGINWDYIPSLQGETKGIWIAADSLVMNAATENKEIAASLMKEITSAEVMAKFHSEMKAFTPLTHDAENFDDPKFAPIYADNVEYLHTLPVADGSNAVMDALYKNLQLMMLDELTPEEAIQNTVDYANTVN